MPGVFSRLLSGSSLDKDLSWGLGGGSDSSSRGTGSQPTHVFSFGPSAGGSSLNATSVRPAGYPPTAPPLYTFTGTPHAKPNIVLYYREASQPNMIGDGTLSSVSSTTQLRVRGMPFTLRMSKMSGDFTLESPITGKMKLKPNPMTGTGLGLYDGTGNKVAKIKPGGGSGEKQLELYVSCDGMFVEVVLLSFLTARMLNKIVEDSVGEMVMSVVTA
ncbi:Amino-acid permease BAT1 [Purpureocillium lavendulum]|uniref:Amino-acid permease BAT1 n=1 Tax=Purpureocillium lavendulum TaxID=1247861 RepID=A0AB34FLD1_9HYPO|nr:Amino-acid permease BAT1 [Purpureocillium lavendulum]